MMILSDTAYVSVSVKNHRVLLYKSNTYIFIFGLMEVRTELDCSVLIFFSCFSIAFFSQKTLNKCKIFCSRFFFN